MGESRNPDWISRWQALMRPYTQAWQDAAGRGMPSAPAWPAFEQWSRLFAAGGGQEETVERLIESAKSYAGFLQSMLAASNAAAQPSAAPTWNEAIARGFGPLGVGANLFEHPAVRAWGGLAGQGGQGLPGFAGSPFMPADGGLGELKAWLNLPAFGYLREHQEHYQKMAVAAVDYQQQTTRYNALMLKASQRGFELFEGKLKEHEQPGRQIESLRALYDLWVDAAEAGYAEIALSDEFRAVYAALVNAQMRLRSQIQQEVERIGADLGMPTRSEIDSIGKRLQALRREVRERSQDGGAALAARIATLQAEFAAFRDGPAQKRAAAPQAAAARRAKTRGGAQHAARKMRAPAVPAAAAAADVGKGKRRKAKAARPGGRAVAATASGNFSSRIEKFAEASLGSRRARSRIAEKTAEPASGHLTKRKKR